MYDGNGNFHSIMYFSDIIINKSNWLCEYKVLKNIFGPLNTRFDCQKSKYVNILNRDCFIIDNTYKNIYEQKSNFFYGILLRKKFQKPCYQNILAREFDITGHNSWYHIYRRKIKNIFDTELAEFNYKLLNNLLCNNLYLSKWKQGVTMYCKNCANEIECTKHLVYECHNVKQIWHIIGTILNFEMKWKHIVVGFYQVDSDYIDFINSIISYTACKIYKYKMFCRIEALEENIYNIQINVKNSFNNLYRLFAYKKYKFANIVRNIADVL